MHDSGKQTNPKDALGIKKVPLHCIPCGPLLEMGLAMMEGGRKYGAHNYRPMGVRASVYYDAAMRHLIDWWEGEDIDPDSGLHHIVKAAACIFVVRDSMLMGNYDDDRPVKYPNGLDISKFNKQATDIIEKYPDCVNPFLEKDREKSKCPEPLIGKLKSLMVDIECVPPKGWQIRLANGKFLMPFFDEFIPPDTKYREINSPYYYETKAIAQEWLECYINSVKDKL